MKKIQSSFFIVYEQKQSNTTIIIELCRKFDHFNRRIAN